MSRLARKSVNLPEKIKCAPSQSGEDIVISHSGTEYIFTPNRDFVKFSIENSEVSFSFKDGVDVPSKMHGILGTTIASFKSAVSDICNGYSAKLTLIGVGFKASVATAGNLNILSLTLGFSHRIKFAIPSTLSIKVEKGEKSGFIVMVSGKKRAEVMEFCHAIRKFRKPEPYKGKGIFVNNETIAKKQGKKK